MKRIILIVLLQWIFNVHADYACQFVVPGNVTKNAWCITPEFTDWTYSWVFPDSIVSGPSVSEASLLLGMNSQFPCTYTSASSAWNSTVFDWSYVTRQRQLGTISARSPECADFTSRTEYYLERDRYIKCPAGYTQGLNKFSGGAQPESSANGYACFTLQPFHCDNIYAPAKNQQIKLTDNNYTSTDVTYYIDDAYHQGNVDWSVKLEYTNSTGTVKASIIDTFTTRINAPIKRTYKSMVGRLTVNATKRFDEGPVAACPQQYAYITGTVIPEATLITRFESLYNYPTVDLLSRIARMESNQQQFVNDPDTQLFGQAAMWPHEQYNDPQNVGLFGLRTTWQRASDWIINSGNFVTLFNNLVGEVHMLESRAVLKFPYLPILSALDREKMAVCLLHHRKLRLTEQYLIPVSNNSSIHEAWSWQLNTEHNPDCVQYIQQLYSLPAFN